MELFKLTHMFYQHHNTVFLEPKHLGYYTSLAEIRKAIAHYRQQPGFAENPKNFEIVRYNVSDLAASPVYEALIYRYTEDFESECSTELGLYARREHAEQAIRQYRQDNPELLQVCGEIETEGIVNRYELNRMEWSEGFNFD